jgi:hypothetical protein
MNDDIPYTSANDPIVDDLLSKYAECRSELEGDLKDICELKDHMKSLFPSDINFRNKFILEEKIKSTTSFYSTMLSIRQEINRTLTNEIEIRRKLSIKQDAISEIDISKLADEVEKIQKDEKK